MDSFIYSLIMLNQTINTVIRELKIHLNRLLLNEVFIIELGLLSQLIYSLLRQSCLPQHSHILERVSMH